MRALVIVLAIILAALQLKLWLGEGGLRELWRLQAAVEEQREENQRLNERNRALAAEVADLKSGLEAVEERARTDLGLIKQDEVFFHVVDTPSED